MLYRTTRLHFGPMFEGSAKKFPQIFNKNNRLGKLGTLA
jgi:hypothetical protein